MGKKLNFKNIKLFSNSWVITLTATLIGVFAALYLNEWVASKKLRNQMEIATENILMEFSSNNESLKGAVTQHKVLLDIFEFLEKYNDEEDGLITSSKIMSDFRAKHPDIVAIEDSILLSSGEYQYNGEISSGFSLPNINLTNIAWETMKNSGINATYGFECLMFLENVDKVTDEVVQQNKAIFDFLLGSDENENIIKELKILIEYEELLIELYSNSKERLTSCGYVK